MGRRQGQSTIPPCGGQIAIALPVDKGHRAWSIGKYSWQLAAGRKQLAEKRGKKKRIFLWERLSSRDFEVYIRLSQAELAPTESVSRKQRTENSRQEAASNWQN
jgi:hypothetical protein